MAENDIISLQESLSDPCDIVQKLYAELEQEREASATAASEALSMILRLQVEKAAEKMEACQYKRMAEEKIHHTEESLATFEEVLYQKDMEIATLKFQVQIYRDRLSKTSNSDPTFIEMDSLKAPSSSRTNASTRNMSFHGIVRRNFTLPAMRFTDNCYMMDIIDDEVFSPLKRRANPKYFDELINTMNDRENASGLYTTLSDSEEAPVSDCNFHCDQVEDKSIKIKETSHSRRIEENQESGCILAHSEFQLPMPIDSKLVLGNRLYSSSSSASNDPSCDSTAEATETMHGTEGISSSSSSRSEYLENLRDAESHYRSFLESEFPTNTICSVKFHDVFEVPQCAKGYDSEPKSRLSKDCNPERKDVPLMTYSIPKLDGQYGKKFLAPKKGVFLDTGWPCKDHKIGVSIPQNVEELWWSDIKQLKKRLQILENDRRISKQEDSDREEEQLKLLREISEQLSMIHSQIKRLPSKKYCHEADNSVLSLMEAMLYFSV